ncbi:unnamed protein product [Lepeophtheirus salmonis]|uniref:(salmon louse) hypothetical protein n=1 Tax=Lepeophtheirus salmonis TaxID=72036 RepID=A0A7R8D090_LEPSM|nr:unnamed protein product [Lepeophtheirus salmonis]CAF2980738.1 unnamed protein product [Lepeophtheirus salmonis]
MSEIDMWNPFCRQREERQLPGNPEVAAKSGIMGKGKSHHRGNRGAEEQGDHGVLSLDPEGQYRTHLLFPARPSDGDIDGRRPGSSSSIMKQLMAWGRKATSSQQSPQQPPPPPVRSPDGLHEYYNRQNKTVSFVSGNHHSHPQNGPSHLHLPIVSRIPGFGGSYSTAASSSSSSGLGGGGGSFREKQNHHRLSWDPVMNGNPPHYPAPPSFIPQRIRPDNSSSPRQIQPSIRLQKIHPTTLPRMNGSPDSPGPLPRGHFYSGQEIQTLLVPNLHSVSKDCFIIPQNNLERFLPDGITLPREPMRSPLLNILEVEDPKLGIALHLMPPLTSLNPHLDSPLAAPTELQKKLATDELYSARDLNVCTEGLLLKNLEKDAEYPYINYYIIQKSRDEILNFYKKTRSRMFDTFNPNKLGYTCDHTFEIFDEVASIARPPVQNQSKKPINDLTGYIVCIYRVFKGDDGEKFERNWLYWTGARMLYKNLPKDVGLRRITLHKSITCPQEVVYILLVECTHFLDHIGETANLLPILREHPPAKSESQMSEEEMKMVEEQQRERDESRRSCSHVENRERESSGFFASLFKT